MSSNCTNCLFLQHKYMVSDRSIGTAVEPCTDLIAEIGAISGTGSVDIDADMTCVEYIEIAASQDITISGPYTVTIGAGFAGSTAAEGGGSLIVNEGTLKLDGITFKTMASDGNRAVWNKGTLSVVDCSFELFQPFNNGTYLNEGGAVSRWNAFLFT